MNSKDRPALLYSRMAESHGLRIRGPALGLLVCLGLTLSLSMPYAVSARAECILCPLDNPYFAVDWLADECSTYNTNRSPTTVACDVYRACTDGTKPVPYPAFCEDRKIVATLCYDKPSLPQCQEIRGGSCNTVSYQMCINTYRYNISTTADVVATHVAACESVNWKNLAGCDICTDANNCPTPLTAYSLGCLDRDAGQCAMWNSFCAKDGAPARAAAAYYCLPVSSRSMLQAPPHYPPVPPSPPSPPSPPPPSSPPPPPSP